MKNVLTPLAKNVSLPFELSAGMSAADAAIQKRIYGSRITALIISKEEMENVKKIITSFEESQLLRTGIGETIKNKTREQKGGFLSMLLETLAASLLGIALIGKGVIRASMFCM